MSVRSEVNRLFSPATVNQAERLAPSQVDALAVQEAAGALLRLKGKPDDQAAYIRALSPSTAAALCRWLTDPAFWTLVAGITKH